jgi:hypothetical protein
MERLFLECAVRAALFAGATAIVLHAMRVKAAAARHGVWTGVLALMLLLPIWTAWGPRVSLRLLVPLASGIADKAAPPADFLSTGVFPSRLLSPMQAALLGVYLLGLCLLLVRLAIGTFRARRLVHDAVLQDNIRTNAACAAPVTVGFLHPTVILPEQWPQWSQAQLDAVLTHESGHVGRRDSLVQWLALLNRALFWFHPVAWWLERHLSALAEEACDEIVLARGHSPREYAHYLIEMARSVKHAGRRLNVAGLAMPGSSLSRRIRQILEGDPAPRISRTRMACVSVACAITCFAFAAGALEHARADSSVGRALVQHEAASTPRSATKFVLGDLKIEGEVHDRDGVRDRVLKGWKDREYDNPKDLAAAVLRVGIRGDFQDRGYFRVVAQEPTLQPLGLLDGKQRILIVATVTEGDQFWLGDLTIQKVPPDHALSIPGTTLREQFHFRNGDLFNVSEFRAGLERVKRSYEAEGYGDAKVEPDIAIDEIHHLINVTLRITEGPNTK